MVFNFDVYTLIELVESKPCLWDKTLEDFRNKILRRNSWREICTFFEPNFETMKDKDKTELLDSVTHKWSSVRDCFMRSLKTKSGDGKKKTYVYHPHLQFLLKVLTPQQTVSSINETEDSAFEASISRSDSVTRPSNASTPEVTTVTDTSPLGSASRNNNMPQMRNKKRMNPVDVEILKAIQCTESRSTDLSDTDEDRAFLQSILPSIKKIADDDKLEFRIQLMELLNKYTNKLRRQPLCNINLNSTESSSAGSRNLSYNEQAIVTPSLNEKRSALQQFGINAERQPVHINNDNILKYTVIPKQNIENQIEINEQMPTVNLPNANFFQYSHLTLQNIEPNQSEVDEDRQTTGTTNEDYNCNLYTATPTQNISLQTSVNSII